MPGCIRVFRHRDIDLPIRRVQPGSEGLTMRTSVQSTSVAAFHHHQESGKALQQQERILAFIERRGGDWSIGELARYRLVNKKK